MSNINTNGINGNYPTPGVNNSTQGMRDNFTSIKNNLTTAATEITDLQSKVIVKSALEGTTLNNDMGGGLISNVQTKGFRASTNPISAGNMGPSVTIDVSKGDVQYGNIVENTTLNFAGWSPAGTQSEVTLKLNVANAQALVRLPETTFAANTAITTGMRQSTSRIENMMTYFTGNSTYAVGYQTPASQSIIPTLSFPNGVSEIQLRFSSTDCGSTIDVEPVTRNQIASRMDVRTPANIGAQGDFPGAMCTDGANLYICTGTYNGSSAIWKYIALNAM